MKKVEEQEAKAAPVITKEQIAKEKSEQAHALMLEKVAEIEKEKDAKHVGVETVWEGRTKFVYDVDFKPKGKDEKPFKSRVRVRVQKPAVSA